MTQHQLLIKWFFCPVELTKVVRNMPAGDKFQILLYVFNCSMTPRINYNVRHAVPAIAYAGKHFLLLLLILRSKCSLTKLRDKSSRTPFKSVLLERPASQIGPPNSVSSYFKNRPHQKFDFDLSDILSFITRPSSITTSFNIFFSIKMIFPIIDT